jgi:hypothetical protein
MDNKHFIVKEKSTIIVEREVEITSLKFISPSQSLSRLKCSACKKSIGHNRPIALIWANNSGWRVCNKCISHLEIDDFLRCPKCKLYFLSIEGDTFWWGGSTHPDVEMCRCPGCNAEWQVNG